MNFILRLFKGFQLLLVYFLVSFENFIKFIQIFSRVSLFSYTLSDTQSLDNPFTHSDFVCHLKRKSPEDFQETLF